MRKYGTLESDFWLLPEIYDLSIEAKLLAVYLRANIVSTMLGCYRMPINYAANDLRMDTETAQKAFEELIAHHLIEYDYRYHVVFIHGFIDPETELNLNQVKGLVNAAADIPSQSSLWSLIIDLIKQHEHILTIKDLQSMKYLAPPIAQRLSERLAEQAIMKSATESTESRDDSLITGSDTDTNPVSMGINTHTNGIRKQEQKPDQKQEQQKKQKQNQKQKNITPDELLKKATMVSLEEVQEVFSCWQSTLDYPDAKLDNKREEMIRLALAMDYSVEQLRLAIKGCSLTPHNMGFNSTKQRFDGLTVILRDAENIERFIYNGKHPPKPQGKSELQQQANGKTMQRWLDKKQAQARHPPPADSHPTEDMAVITPIALPDNSIKLTLVKEIPDANN